MISHQLEPVTHQIEIMLKRANGRGKVRTLDIEDVLRVIEQALVDEYGWRTGGTVANAYKYAAETTMAFAVANGPDWVALRIGRNNATSSPATWAGASSVRERDCRKWASRQTLYTLVKDGWTILPREKCLKVTGRGFGQ